MSLREGSSKAYLERFRVDVTVQSAQVNQPQRGAGGILGALIGAIAGAPMNQGALPGGSILSERGTQFFLGVGSRITITTTQQ